MREEKRKFYAWAGKRSDDWDIERPEEKRKFYAWAGKRADDDVADLDDLRLQEQEGVRSYSPGDKRKFYAWAGRK